MRYYVILHRWVEQEAGVEVDADNEEAAKEAAFNKVQEQDFDDLVVEQPIVNDISPVERTDTF